MFSGDKFKSIRNIRSKLSLRRNRQLPDRSNGDQYFYTTNFEQATDKSCMDLDKLNEKIYINNIKVYNKTNKQLEKMPFKLEKQPDGPPRPNNYENLLLWRQRNVKKNVQDQSVAIMYLLSKGYRIKYPISKQNGIEPYLAIKIAGQIAKKTDENIMNEVLKYQEKMKLESIDVSDFNINKLENMTDNTNNNSNNPNNTGNNSNNNNYNNSNNIPREFINSSLMPFYDLRRTQSLYLSKTDEEMENKSIKPNVINVTNNMTLPNTPTNKSKEDNKMTCENPEHHNFDDKVNFFDRRRFHSLSLYPSLSEENIASYNPSMPIPIPMERRNTVGNCNMYYPNTLQHSTQIPSSAPSSLTTPSAPPPYFNNEKVM